MLCERVSVHTLCMHICIYIYIIDSFGKDWKLLIYGCGSGVHSISTDIIENMNY